MCVLITLIGCTQNDESTFYDSINGYQGVWRDTLYNNNEMYLEDLIVHENAIEYVLSDAQTHVVYDQLNGTLVVGNENKIGWNCISPLTNRSYRMTWSVRDLTTYQMKLFSQIMGEHTYKRVYYPSIDEYEVKDTLDEILQFRQFLPLSKSELVEKFGTYNIMENDGTQVTYLINHPLFDKISFRSNYDEGSFYSYILHMKDWSQCGHIIGSQYTKLQDVNGTIEYIDADSLETSDHIITTDSMANHISISPIEDYDYWPNASCFIGMSLQDVMNIYEGKYIYRYHEYQNDGLFEYAYQTGQDSICSSIYIVTDSSGTINYSGVVLFKIYLTSKKAEALEEIQKISYLLSRRYSYDRYELDTNKNKVYYYYYDRAFDHSRIEIKLRLRYYQENVRKYYRIQIDYGKF